MRKCFFIFALLVLCPWITAQQTMNNDSVVKLVKAGLSDDLIVTTIQGNTGSYDTSADSLITLKSAGVSEKIISAIITKSSNPAAMPALPPLFLAAQDPNDPNAPHDPGVYLFASDAYGHQQMIFIDRVGAGREKTSNVLGAAFSYGIAKAKVKAEIPGPHASVRSHSQKPAFYMFFPSSANLGGFGGNDVITSPTQFSLLLLEEKKDHRETAVAKMGFASASAGTDSKRTTLFSSTRVRNGVYQITPNSALPPGEYAFIASTGMAGDATHHTVVIYDFGID